MPGRGPQTFKKRQKEQQRKERQEEKMAKRLARKNEPPAAENDDQIESETGSDAPESNDSEQPGAGGFAAQNLTNG
jgi:hypothetical protein